MAEQKARAFWGFRSWINDWDKNVVYIYNFQSQQGKKNTHIELYFTEVCISLNFTNLNRNELFYPFKPIQHKNRPRQT